MKKKLHLFVILLFLTMGYYQTIFAQEEVKIKAIKVQKKRSGVAPITLPSSKKKVNGIIGEGIDPGGTPPFQCVAADAGNNVTIACGASTTLGTTYNSNYSYSWSPATNLSSATTVNPVASPKQTTTYTLTMTPKPNLIENGDFENGNLYFSSDYSYGISSYATSTYTIANNGSNVYNWWCGTSPTSGSNMLIVDGATNSNQRVWYQTISVTPNTFYGFSGQFLNLFNTNGHNDPFIVVKVNGTTIAYSALGFNGCQWTTLSGGWQSGATDYTATIAIYSDPAVNNDGNGNDVGIDNLCFTIGNCPITTSQVTVFLTGGPTITPAGSIDICYYWEPGFSRTISTNLTSNIMWKINDVEIPNENSSSLTITTNTIALDNSPSSKLFPSRPFRVTDLSTGCSSEPLIVNAIMMPEFDWGQNFSASPYGTGFNLIIPNLTDSWVGNSAGYGSNSSLSWQIISPSDAIALSSTGQSPMSVYFPNISSNILAQTYFVHSLTMTGSDYPCVNTTDYESIYLWNITTYKHVFNKKTPTVPIGNMKITPEILNVENDVIVYPNPVKNKLTIASINEIEKVQIFSNKGVLIKSNNTKGRLVSIDVNELISGIYFVNIFSSKETKVKKVLVIK